MVIRRVCAWLTAGLCGLAACQTSAAKGAEPAVPGTVEVDSPLSPEQALAAFRLDAGLRIELAASEPEVVDPVAARFDENGRLWVVEMRDYPNGPPAGSPPLSRIKLLDDLDGDGRFETAQTFADELPFPTGLQPWQGGAIVTLAGKIVYLKDDDGDGRCDTRQTWYEGFAAENPQLRANHPRFALDNHVYVANGLRGGRVVDVRRAKGAPIDIGGRDLRFDPRSGAAEAVTGNGQFGLTFDDFGNRFVCSNRNPLVQAMLEERYLARNPYFAAPATVQDAAAAGEASRVYPLTRAWTTSILHAGQFTAACGIDIYRGGALPPMYAGNAFICEPTGNLVHREILGLDGPAYTAVPASDKVEFLASPDPWFRPVNLEQGPDGALYVVDMYRAVIEHPDWVPEELKRRPDERWGDDRGRIWRVTGAKPPVRAAPRLSRASTAELVAALQGPNGWQRETAARLLYERQDRTAVAPLERIVAADRSPASKGRADGAKSATPVARVHALWTLHGLGRLTAKTLAAAAGDSHPRVREQAALLSEQSGQPLPPAAWRRLSTDEDARVRFQTALSLGNEASIEALTAILYAGARDRWTRYAVATCVSDRAAVLLEQALNAPPASIPDREARVELVGDLAQLVGARTRLDEATRALAAASRVGSHDPYGLVVLQRLGQALRQRGIDLRTWLARDDEGAAALEEAARKIFDEAVATAEDASLDPGVRAIACDVVAYLPADEALPLLGRLLAETDRTVKGRTLMALGTFADERAHRLLVEEWSRQTPALRATILDALLANPDRILSFFDEIAAGRVRASELDASRTAQLVGHADPRVRERAAQLLSGAEPADRARVLQEYRMALALAADARRGREVFRKQCATCHRIGDVGVDVAPSIADERTKTIEQLLVDVLQPSKAIDSNYVGYSVVLKDGRSLTGIVAAETAASITLKLAEGKTELLLRADVDQIQSSGVSFMPEGLERNVSPQDMLDLLTFIKNWRYLDGAVPGSGAKRGGGE